MTWMDIVPLLLFSLLLLLGLGWLKKTLQRLIDAKNDADKTQEDSTKEIFANLRDRLATVDNRLANMGDLSRQVTQLQAIFENKQQRGRFGEVQLYALVEDALPSQAYTTQATLSNGRRPDVLIQLPNPPGSIVVDAKFPLEDYQRSQSSPNEDDRLKAFKAMASTIKNHAKDIAERYLIAGETAPWAVMFLPSESIFLQLHAHLPDVVTACHKLHIALASPTTLMALLLSVRAILQDADIRKNAHEIQKEMGQLTEDMRRLQDRLAKLNQHYDGMGSTMEAINTSVQKIAKKGEKIQSIDTSSASQESSPPLPSKPASNNDTPSS